MDPMMLMQLLQQMQQGTMGGLSAMGLPMGAPAAAPAAPGPGMGFNSAMPYDPSMSVPNPMNSGLAAITMAQNPELAAQAAAEAGIPPPTLSGWDATVTPAGGLGSAISGQDPLAMLKGFKAPEQPKPIMNAGVSGAQKAPELGVKGGADLMTQMLAMLQQAQSRQNPLTVPGLGAMLGGR